jgi:ABC-type multidrug transport system fused ATPase/permease subunit
MVMRPPVLILDEATSSLDAENEAKVHEAMTELLTKVGASVLVIAHRLSTIRDADEVCCSQLFFLPRTKLKLLL